MTIPKKEKIMEKITGENGKIHGNHWEIIGKTRS